MTQTTTFTVTHAEYLASKIAADLKQMQIFYGDPSDNRIDNYVKELTILLKAGYVKSVDYGYKKNDKYVIAVSYEVSEITGSLIDNNPGRVPSGVSIVGASFGSYMRKSSKFYTLPAADQASVIASLPFPRGEAADPLTNTWGTQDRTYSAGNTQINRTIIK